VHGWSEQEYLLWIQKHEDEGEQLALLEKAVDDQLAAGVKEGKEGEDGEEEFVSLIREVLEHARHEDSRTVGL
jgi:hypothetical protein